jgi:spore coat polysaccharide biosynthesis protein SpsF
LISNDKIVAIVQARMGSSRLPGKMLRKLGSQPIIEWVLTRVASAKRVDEVMLATSIAPENDALQSVAASLRIATYRGDENDVLDRYLKAAAASSASHVVRVCADNPFVAPEELDRLVDYYKQSGTEYAFNHVPRLNNKYPDGLGGEMLSIACLQRVGRSATEKHHREHVTLYIWDHADQFAIGSFPAPEPIAFPGVRLDIDTEADLKRLNELACAKNIHASAQQVVDSYRARYGDVGL